MLAEATHAVGDLRFELLEEAIACSGRILGVDGYARHAAHDYAKTAFSYIERETDREVWVEVPEQPEEANLVESAVEAAAPESGRPEPTARASTVEELIAGGESRTVEFKSSARWSYGKGDRDEVIERTIVKTIAGFMNAHGGTLLVGVGDEGDRAGEGLQARQRPGA